MKAMKIRAKLLFLALLALTACDKEPHEVPLDVMSGEAIVTLSLKNEVAPEVPLQDVHLFWFNETDQLYQQDYYSSMEDLARARIVLPEGSYTVFAVLNVGQNFPM